MAKASVTARDRDALAAPGDIQRILGTLDETTLLDIMPLRPTDLLGKGCERAQEILRTRRADLHAGAQLLLKRETVTLDDFPAIRSAKVAEPKLTVVPV